MKVIQKLGEYNCVSQALIIDGVAMTCMHRALHFRKETFPCKDCDGNNSMGRGLYIYEVLHAVHFHNMEGLEYTVYVCLSRHSELTT